MNIAGGIGTRTLSFETCSRLGGVDLKDWKQCKASGASPASSPG